MSEFVSTLTDYYRNGGLIARGPSGGNYTYVIVGDQAIPLIAAAYNKGIRDHAGYEQTANHYMEHYIAKGFVPETIFGKGMHREGCAMTLFFCLSGLVSGAVCQEVG